MNDIWQRIWRIGLSLTSRFGGPTDEQRARQEQRADELRQQNERGYTIRDRRKDNDDK